MDVHSKSQADRVGVDMGDYMAVRQIDNSYQDRKIVSTDSAGHWFPWIRCSVRFVSYVD